MEKLSIEEIEKYSKGKLLINKNNNIVLKISIDSREVDKDTLFIPIIGERFDGHNFMESAYESGCRNFLCDKKHKFSKNDINLIEVEDTSIALGDIAKGYKEKFNIPLIAITGSVGKTSTKDIIYSVLKEKYNTLKTEGNLNTNIGLPKTLLNLSNKNEMAVLEIGMDKKGEISYLTNIINPDVAIITNIGMSHIMNFKNQEGIFNAKMEIVEGLKKDGLLIVNGDDKFLKTVKGNDDYKVLTFGFNKENDIYCKEYSLKNNKISFKAIYKEKEYDFIIDSIAKHNIGNALAAILLGFNYDMSAQEIQKGLLNLEFSSNRLDIFDTSNYKIINDTYNSSYDSVKSALEVLNSFNGRKVSILGDILEIGDFSKEIHEKIGKELKCDVLITIGEYSKYITDEAQKRGIESYHYFTKDEFYKNMDNVLLKGDIILVKASRALHLDEVVEVLKNCQK